MKRRTQRKQRNEPCYPKKHGADESRKEKNRELRTYGPWLVREPSNENGENCRRKVLVSEKRNGAAQEKRTRRYGEQYAGKPRNGSEP